MRLRSLWIIALVTLMLTGCAADETKGNAKTYEMCSSHHPSHEIAARSAASIQMFIGLGIWVKIMLPSLM